MWSDCDPGIEELRRKTKMIIASTTIYLEDSEENIVVERGREDDSQVCIYDFDGAEMLSMSPQEAREVAESLIKCADAIQTKKTPE